MTLYGFFRTSCVYDSGAMLVSLHYTKRGAWEACRKARVAAFVEARETALRIGRMSCGDSDYLSDQRFSIKPIKVQT